MVGVAGAVVVEAAAEALRVLAVDPQLYLLLQSHLLLAEVVRVACRVVGVVVVTIVEAVDGQAGDVVNGNCACATMLAPNEHDFQLSIVAVVVFGRDSACARRPGLPQACRSG